MDPILEKVVLNGTSSFAVKEEILPFIEIGWHFHPEFELTFFTESTGQQFIGDHTSSFGPGELLLLGPNIPHFMRNDPVYQEGKSTLRIRAIVVHFDPHFMGASFFELPELHVVKQLLNRAGRGLRFSGAVQKSVGQNMETLLELEGYPRLRMLIDILHELAMAEEFQVLSSIGYSQSFTTKDAERMTKVYEYLLQNYDRDLSLTELASQVNMNDSAFCKFLKKRTGKTFSHLLNEIRIGLACRLFMDENVTISAACYSSGYNNLSYFCRKFKAITSYTPKEYRARFLSLK